MLRIVNKNNFVFSNFVYRTFRWGEVRMLRSANVLRNDFLLRGYNSNF